MIIRMRVLVLCTGFGHNAPKNVDHRVWPEQGLKASEQSGRRIEPRIVKDALHGQGDHAPLVTHLKNSACASAAFKTLLCFGLKCLDDLGGQKTIDLKTAIFLKALQSFIAGHLIKPETG